MIEPVAIRCLHRQARSHCYRRCSGVLRDLARQGLKDGDAVVPRDGSRGRLNVSRDQTQVIVVRDDGSEVPFSRGEWMRSERA
jgi:hypothetical protein